MVDTMPSEILDYIHTFLDGTNTAPMERATKAGRLGTVKVLLALKTPPGRSLRFSIILNRMNIARLLVASGASTNDKYIPMAIRNKRGKIRREFEELIQCREFRL